MKTKKNIILLLIVFITATAYGNDLDATLLEAASNGDSKEVINAIENGADINGIDEEGWTPLRAAYKNGHADIAYLLIETGANVDFYDTAMLGDIEKVKILMEKNDNRRRATLFINYPSDLGRTALMEASESGHIDLVKYFIESEAQVNYKVDYAGNGDTALLLASAEGHIEIVKILIKSGADVTDYNNKGTTALQYASKNGHSEVVKLLINAGATE